MHKNREESSTDFIQGIANIPLVLKLVSVYNWQIYKLICIETGSLFTFKN